MTDLATLLTNKMATPLESCTKFEIRSSIRFLHAEQIKPIEIYRRISSVYGANSLSQDRVYKWIKKFENGVTTLDDSPRPGQAYRVINKSNVLGSKW